MERSLYRPLRIEIEGCRRNDEILAPGHPLYLSLCTVCTLENVTEHPVTYPVFPTGCMTLAFRERNGEQQNWLCGPADEIRKTVLLPGDQLLVLEFMPGSNTAFLRCAVSDLTNRCADITQMIRNGIRLKKIAERDIPVSLKALLMSRVLRVESFERESDYLIHFCTEEILRAGGAIKISELAKKAGFTERYISQIFGRHIGLSPKTYAEIIRLQTSLGNVLAADGQKGQAAKKSLLEIAVENGYFDHAHMNRAYQRFLHCSSGALRRKGLAAIDMDDVKEILEQGKES
jgi:AraC-like DNA-binding protein